jgi:hypothetical protein
MTVILRASELGRCVKASAAILQGFTPLPTPEKVQGWYDAGNEHETANEAALLEEGWRITGQQMEVIISCDDARVEGHLDGIIHGGISTTPLGTRIWESKSPGAWAKFEKAYKTGDWSDPLAHRYAWQASVYMLAKDMELMVTCLDSETIRSFIIETPPFTLQQVEQRVREILTFAGGDLPALCSQTDWPCPVAYLHIDPDYDLDPELDLAAKDSLFARQMIKEWKTKQDRADKKVQELRAGRDRVRTEQVTVSWYEQSGAGRYDKDAMIADGVLDRYFTPGKSSTRMKITEKGADNAVDE